MASALTTPLGPRPTHRAPTNAALLKAAAQARDTGPAFRPPDTTARNAHRTNTRQEMLDALRGQFEWMEGDLRQRNGRTVMAHDVADRGLSLRDWLMVGKASGRGLKMDFKEAAAIQPAIAAAKRAGVADDHLIFNIAVDSGTPYFVRKIRAAFPSTLINLSVSGNSPAAITAARQAADDARKAERELGLPPGPIAFPMDANGLTRQAVRRLREKGDVAVWNNPDVWSPPDIAATKRELISWGVNGMIDLRTKH